MKQHGPNTLMTIRRVKTESMSEMPSTLDATGTTSQTMDWVDCFASARWTRGGRPGKGSSMIQPRRRRVSMGVRYARRGAKTGGSIRRKRGGAASRGVWGGVSVGETMVMSLGWDFMSEMSST